MDDDLTISREQVDEYLREVLGKIEPRVDEHGSIDLDDDATHEVFVVSVATALVEGMRIGMAASSAHLAARLRERGISLIPTLEVSGAIDWPPPELGGDS